VQAFLADNSRVNAFARVIDRLLDSHITENGGAVTGSISLVTRIPMVSRPMSPVRISALPRLRHSRLQ
jgi:hypothetical protein